MRMTIRRLRPLLTASLILFLTAATLPASGAEEGAGEKDVWIVDQMLRIPFVRVRVPRDWTVEGNVAWTFGRPVMAMTAWVRLTDPATRTVYETAAPIAAFVWRESPSIPYREHGDGTFSIEHMTYMLKPRTGRELLAQFIQPIVAKVAPDARTIWLRGGCIAAEQMRDSMRKELLELRKHMWLDDDDKPAITTSGGLLLVERGDVRTLFAAVRLNVREDRPATGKATTLWEWRGVDIVTAPKEHEPEDGAIGRVFRDRVVLNPDWRDLVNRSLREQRETYRPGDTWPIINFAEYYAQARCGGAMLEQPARADEAPELRAQYSRPGAEAIETAGMGNKGYVNAIVEALVLGDSPFGTNLSNLQPIEGKADDGNPAETSPYPNKATARDNAKATASANTPRTITKGEEDIVITGMRPRELVAQYAANAADAEARFKGRRIILHDEDGMDVTMTDGGKRAVIRVPGSDTRIVANLIGELPYHKGASLWGVLGGRSGIRDSIIINDGIFPPPPRRK